MFIKNDEFWNDCGMMVVGQGLSKAEDRAHVSMWAMLASPMIVGYDLRQTSPAAIAALKQARIVARSQDTLGKQATLVTPSSPPTPSSTRLCLGSLGIFGSDPEQRTHLVPCNHSPKHFAAAASRWVYDNVAKQLRHESVTGQSKPAKSDVCLATPTLKNPEDQRKLNTASCATGGKGWQFSKTGVLFVS